MAPRAASEPAFRAELVPTWAKIAAWTVPLTCVPSVTWRLVTAIDAVVDGGPCMSEDTPLWELIYVIAVLPTVQLGFALLTIGLIRPWGEVLPRWIPGLGGRRVPVGFAISAATTGAVLVAVVFTLGKFPDVMMSFWNQLGLDRPPGGRPIPEGCSRPGWEVLRWYLPMALWPPLLLAVTWHYRRRRSLEAALADGSGVER
ncbi:hypothetical protein GCM10029992_35160 [Glycomyces albus]